MHTICPFPLSSKHLIYHFITYNLFFRLAISILLGEFFFGFYCLLLACFVYAECNLFVLSQLHIICHAVNNLTSTPTLQWLLVPLKKNGKAPDRVNWLRAKKCEKSYIHRLKQWWSQLLNKNAILFGNRKKIKAKKKFGSNGTLKHRSLLKHPLLVFQECFVGRILFCVCERERERVCVCLLLSAVLIVLTMSDYPLFSHCTLLSFVIL